MVTRAPKAPAAPRSEDHDVTGPVAAVPVVRAKRAAPKRAAPRQAAAPPRRRKATVRRVTRVVRRVDAWSVFKISVLFFVTLYIVLLVAGVLLWGVVSSSGTLDNVENFISKTFALDSFEFSGAELFRASWILGLVMVVAGTAAAVAATVFFNLLSDLTGGVRVTVLEEETQLVGTD